jgi:PAS domain S-box-containing protein
VNAIPWRRRIGTRILLSSILIAVVAILCTSVVIVFLSADVLRDNISQRNLQIARRAASEIALYLRDSLDQLATVAEVLSPLHGDQLLQELVLENLVFSLDRYQRLELADEEGWILASSRLETGGICGLDRATLAGILAGKGYLSDVYLSADNLPFARVGLPVKVLGRSRHVLVAELNLRTVWVLIDEILIGERGMAFLASRAGTLLAHPDKALILASLSAARLPAPPAPLTAEGRVLIQRAGSGQELLMVYVPVEGTDWIVALEQPIREAFLPAGNILGQSSVLILTGILAAAGVSALLARRLSDPLKELIAGTRLIHMGNLDHRIDAHSRDEIGQLSRAFNEMVDRLKEQSQALRESESRYRLLTENVSDLIFSLDREGRFEFVNRQVERLTGYGREHFLGQLFPDVLTADSAQSGRDTLERLIGGWNDAADLQVRFQSREGEGIDLELKLARFRDPAGATLYYGTGRDVTERKRLQQQLLQSEKLSALGEIISGVAHELNNPLTTIMGFASLMQEDYAPGSSTRDDLQKMIQEAGRAAKIVQNLLTFARKYPPEKSPCRINEIIESVLQLRSYEMSICNIAIERRMAPDLPPTMADPNQLRQVFLNIINNAIQALQDNTKPCRLRVETRAGGNTIRIAFTDSGPGIPAVYLPRIFDPFFTTKPVGKGTGLGLSVSHGIIQEHGGRITARSIEGQGACFEIELPLEPVPGEPAADGMQIIAAKPANRKLLVVDDETEILRFVGRSLSSDRCVVDLADSGEKAVEYLGQREYDLVISDLRMPGMDGYRLHTWIRENRPLLLNRLIFISGDILGRELKEFVERTGAVYMQKPFRADDLRRAIREALARGAGDRGGSLI